MRSKTRWFTGFCNSHQVSHFATFFIDARAEISVAESRSRLECCDAAPTGTVSGPMGGARHLRLPWRIPRRGFVVVPGRDRTSRARPGTGGGRAAVQRRPPVCQNAFAGRTGLRGIDNDPSAGSPTETLLRLLLPLNDKVQWTSHNVAGSGPPTSPRSEHFTGPFNR